MVCQAAKTDKDREAENEEEKCSKYGPHLTKELVRNGLCFKPAIWSQEDRPGKGAMQVLRDCAHLLHDMEKVAQLTGYCAEWHAKSPHAYT